jgi:hypothetical protein
VGGQQGSRRGLARLPLVLSAEGGVTLSWRGFGFWLARVRLPLYPHWQSVNMAGAFPCAGRVTA